MIQDNDHMEQYRRTDWGLHSSSPQDGNNGAFLVPRNGVYLLCIISDQLGWDHVSVSVRSRKGPQVKRCPTWEEMSFVKSFFFKKTETVVQLHVPEAEHININNYCLHLWRKQGFDYPLPPAFFV